MRSSAYAEMKNVQMLPSKEECALGMGQSAKYAAVKDAPIKLRLVEFARGIMEQRSSTKDAAVKDARVKLSREECALGTGQKRNDAAVKDALI